jgi:hypothetical protein
MSKDSARQDKAHEYDVNDPRSDQAISRSLLYCPQTLSGEKGTSGRNWDLLTDIGIVGMDVSVTSICGAGHGRLDRDSLEEAVSEPASQARYTISVFDRHSRQSEE